MRRRAGWLGRFGGVPWSLGEVPVLPEVCSVAWRKIWSDRAVAVVADTWWQANMALQALPITWDEGPNAKLSSAAIDAMLDEGLSSSENVFIGNESGDINTALKQAAKKVHRLKWPLPVNVLPAYYP